MDDWNPNGNGRRGEIHASMSDSVRFNNLLLAKVNKVDAGLNEYTQKFSGQVNEDITYPFSMINQSRVKIEARTS